MLSFRIHSFLKSKGNHIIEKIKRVLCFFTDYHVYNIIPPKKYVVVVFNKNNETGLADRLRHCISIYLYCRDHNYSFKINHQFPFRLEQILNPVYDWRLRKHDFSRSVIFTKRINVWSYYKNNKKDKKAEEDNQISILSKKIKNNRYQYHILGNAHIHEEMWRTAFDELFSPSYSIKAALNAINLPQMYDAVTFRFQNLIGDFNEGNFEVLDNDERNELISKCRSELISYYNQGKFRNNKILITSDSTTFLKVISDIPFVITIPGSIVHPGFGTAQDKYAYNKSFVDLLALRGAQTITLFMTGKMYESGFPEFAARIGHNNFSLHRF